MIAASAFAVSAKIHSAVLSLRSCCLTSLASTTSGLVASTCLGALASTLLGFAATGSAAVELTAMVSASMSGFNLAASVSVAVVSLSLFMHFQGGHSCL